MRTRNINEALSVPDPGQPVVSLAVGVAFADRIDPGESILEDAEKALSSLKDRGKNSCAFH